jgi:hypothetical protein
VDEPMGIALAVYERVVMASEKIGLLETCMVTIYKEIVTVD